MIATAARIHQRFRDEAFGRFVDDFEVKKEKRTISIDPVRRN